MNENVFSEVCPYCDSKDAFVYTNGDKQMFLCHDCQRHLPFHSVPKNETKMTYSKISFNPLLKLCTAISELPDDHYCRQYVVGRGIDPKHFSYLYFTEKFPEMSSTVEKNVPEGPRLVIPFFNEKGEMYAMQGRAFEDSKNGRYITIVFDKNEEVLYGRERVNLNEPFVVVEGPIDSLFLNNCVASAGVGNISDKYQPNATICLDNEPRNKDIVRSNKKNIDRGFRVVVWPDSISEKDINDMYQKGVDISEVIRNNTYAGMKALIELNAWKKI